MTVTAIPPDATGGAKPGADFVTDLIDVATYYAVHTDTPRPTPRLNIPVPPGAPGARLAALDEIAEHLEVEVEERDGMLIAERQFGEFILEAHLALLDASTPGHLVRGAVRTVAA